jgi:hypothetical protein
MPQPALDAERRENAAADGQTRRDAVPPSTAQRYSAVSSLQQLGPNFLLRKESGAQLIIAFHRAEERTGP